MPAWATYRLSDFLLFSPRTYWRLFELYNASLWPAQLAALCVGVALAVIALHGGRRAAPAVCAMLAGCWLWVAWAFHLQRYASINWAATWFAAGFALEGLLLFGAGAFGARLRLRSAGGVRASLGVGLLVYAVLVQPCIGVLLGRPWRQSEVFALAPDPTAVATLGVLLLLHRAHDCESAAAKVAVRVLWPLPVLWCLVSGATLWTMGSAHALVLPIAALIAIVAAAWRGSGKRSGTPPHSG